MHLLDGMKTPLELLCIGRSNLHRCCSYHQAVDLFQSYVISIGRLDYYICQLSMKPAEFLLSRSDPDHHRIAYMSPSLHRVLNDTQLL